MTKEEYREKSLKKLDGITEMLHIIAGKLTEIESNTSGAEYEMQELNRRLRK